jgi:hypothetical protein
MNRVLPVIFSGGIGARLWPVSRVAHPKSFMQLPQGEIRRFLRLPVRVQPSGQQHLRRNLLNELHRPRAAQYPVRV